VQKLLENPGVPPKARDGDLLALAGRQEGRLLRVLRAAKDEDAALVQKPVAAKRGRVGERLLLLTRSVVAVASFSVRVLLVVIETPP